MIGARPSLLARLAPALLAKHFVAAAIATLCDFVVMIALVEVAGIRAAVATLFGALAGAVVNFSLGRAWVYRSTGARGPQAIRYALVSAAGAGWNAAGEHVLLAIAGTHYVATRMVVSLAVSLFWNYPMQRYVVFADPEPRVAAG